MTAAWIGAALIFILVLATYVLEALLLAIRAACWLVVYVVFPLVVLLVWLVALPFRPKSAMAWMQKLWHDSKPSA